MSMILLDFVGGTHGNFLEVVANRALGFVTQDFDPFTQFGTSHKKPKFYRESRQIVCDHWFENDPTTLSRAFKVIRITFDENDLLLASSISLLRSSDLNIDNDTLHINTVEKLVNTSYAVNVLEQLYQSYDFLDRTQADIPRNVLREYFKFGFRDHKINGLWQKQQNMLSVKVQDEFRVAFKDLYDVNQLSQVLADLATWLERPLVIDDWFTELHARFLAKNPYLHDQDICDSIIHAVVNQQHTPIPRLSLMQESYINGKLENLFGKEMPFHQSEYFTNTKDVLQYINHQASSL